jgi:hypothetical protein
MSLLVSWFGDHRDDPPGPQIPPDRPRGVGLVGAKPVRSTPRPPEARPGDLQMRHQVREHRSIPGLAWPDEYDLWIAMTVDQLMDLR